MKRCLLISAAVLLAVPVAYSAGDGLAANEGIGQHVGAFFDRGGMLMWPILVCSVVSVALMIDRAWSLRSRAVFRDELFDQVRDLVRQGELERALHIGENDDSPFGRLLTTCLSRADADGFEMEAALEEAGSRELYDLRQNCRPLGVIADVTPLLGLMGTVIGMIKAFDVVAKAGALGRTELLAEGIGEALITTAFGLGVAIPSILAYHYYRAKVDRLVRIMEDACIEILALLRKRMKTA